MKEPNSPEQSNIAEGADETASEEIAAPEVAAEEEEATEASQVAEESPPALEQLLEEAKARADENYNNFLRSVADLETYRRRVNREKDELRQFAAAGLLEAVIPIYDNMSLGLQSAEQSADPKVVIQGIEMVLTQFRTVLEENGVREIDPTKGDEFDPNHHEAFQTQPSEEIEEGKVLQTLRKGFLLNERLIRPASVIVSGAAGAEATSGE